MTIISNGRLIELNNQQISALNKLWEFLRDKKRQFICLCGNAGTGKTTILKEALRDYVFVSAITAPTHQAKKVASYATGLDATTIHSLCGLRPNMDLEDFSNKNMLFEESGKNKMGEYDIIAVDEASMLNTPLLELIKAKAKFLGTKIIFLGDDMQLAPVKESRSPVFYDDEIEKIYINKLERQKNGNPLIDIYKSILSDINSTIDLFEYKTNINDNREGAYFTPDIRHYGNIVLEYFSSSAYEGDPNVGKIICQYNDSIRKWNNYIRKNIFEGINSPLKKNEVLKSYNSVYDDTSNEFIIQNSAEYKILDITGNSETYAYFDKKDKKEVYGYYAKVLDVDNGNIVRIFILDSTVRENVETFVETEQRLVNFAKNATSGRKWHWKNYYDFKNKIFLLGDIKDRAGNKLVKKDFDFAYALTVHKSQGSTYGQVFVDNNEMDGQGDCTYKNRLKYVALSRPTNMAYITY